MINLGRAAYEIAQSLKKTISFVSDTVGSREINVKYPPIPLEGLTGTKSGETAKDETEKLENIMKFAKDNKFNKVYIPSGTFYVKYINYRDGIYIDGAGINRTFIKALASTEEYFMKSVDSPTQQIKVSNFTLDGGAVNNGQHGLGLIAYPLQTSPFHGGVWYSVFEDLKIQKFKGAQIIIKKGAEELAPASLPNQFNVFQNVQAYRVADVNSYCLYMENQIGQHTFRNCGFDCPTNGVASAGTNIYVDGGNTILFEMVTSQNSEKVYDIKNNKNTTIRNGWIENSKYAITTYKASNLNIEKVNFANACSDGSGGGYGVKSTDTADSILVERCIFNGNVDTSVWGNGQSFEIKTLNNLGTVVVKGTIRQISAVDNLNLSNAKFVYLSNQNNTISTLKHSSASGELITVKFHGAGTTTINNAGNIKLPNGISSVTFKQGDTLVLTPTEIENGLMFVTTSKFNDDSTTNSINLLIKKEANIVSFGASSDPAADNTSAFTNAYNSIKDTGGTIVIPDGEFNSPKLNIADSKVRVSGYGTLKNGGLLIGHSSTIKDLNFLVEGITIAYDNIVTGKNGIELRNARRGKILDVNFKNVDKSIYTHPIATFQHSSRVMISNTITDGANYVLYVDRAAGFNDYTVGDFHFINNQAYGGINYNHVYGLGIDGLVMTGNTLFFPSYSGASPTKDANVYLDYGNFIVIQGNNMFEAGTEGIRMNKVQNPTINGNNIVWCGQRVPSSGIRVSGGNQIGQEFVFGSISGNNIMFPTESGIVLNDNVGHMTIGSNTVRSAGSGQYYYGTTALNTVSHFGISTATGTKGNVIGVNNTDDNVNNFQGENVFMMNYDINKNMQKTNQTQTITTNDTTIDVKGTDRIHFAQTAATTIVALNSAYSGQEITIIAFNANTTIQNNGSISLKGSANATIPNGGLIKLLYTTGKWFEVSRNF